MDYVQLGSSGLRVSRICLGMMSYGETTERAWHLAEDDAAPIVAQAAEAGVNFFDTADVYSGGLTEEITGRLLGKVFARRDDYVLATKVGLPAGPGPNDRGLSRKRVLASIDGSLRRLGTDYVDLYQIHRWDSETPIEETMAVLHEVVQAGKARYLGASSMFGWQFAQAQYTAQAGGWTRFASMQNHYNLVYREEEREMIPLCLDQGVGVIPYSPLARGLLGGRRRRGGGGTVRAGSDPLAGEMYADADFDVVDAVRAVAAELGLSPAQVSLAWLLGKPGIVAPVVGATRPQYLAEAVGAAGISLAADTVARLEAPYRPHRVLGHHRASGLEPRPGRGSPSRSPGVSGDVPSAPAAVRQAGARTGLARPRTAPKVTRPGSAAVARGFAAVACGFALRAGACRLALNYPVTTGGGV